MRRLGSIVLTGVLLTACGGDAFSPEDVLGIYNLGGQEQVGGRGGFSVDSVCSVADLGWGGRATLSPQSLTPEFPEEPYV